MAPKQRKKADGLTIDRALRVVGLSEPRVSPDGELVAFVRSRVRQGEKTRGSEIWAVPSQEAPCRQLTRGPQDGQPRWSPEGRTLAFVRKLEGDKPAQVFTMPRDGGEPLQLGELLTSPEALAYRPGGKRISFLAPEPDDRATRERKESGDDARVFCDDDRPKRLWSLSVKSGKAKPVSPPEPAIWEYDWLPDGERAAVIYTDEPRIDAQFFRARLGLVNAKDGSVAPIEVPFTFLHGPRVSPDGRYLALMGSGAGVPHGAEAWVVDLETGAATCLAPKLRAGVMAAEWVGASTDLLLHVGEGMGNALYTVSVDAPGKLHRVCTRLPTSLDGTEVSADGGQVFTVAQEAGEPPELWCADIGSGEAARLTDENAKSRALATGRRSTVHWQSTEDLRIEGGLILPPGYKAGRRYPAILLVHGGPAGRFRNDFSLLPGQLLAQEGYVVLMPNPRGSSGYGEGFTRGNFGDWGGGDFRDLMAGVDWLIAEGLADEARLGIYGGSYGGYMTAWTVTQTDRFRAAVCQCGLTNLYSFHAQTDITPGFLELYLGTSPYEDPALYQSRSPMTHIGYVRTPTLLLHGEQDVRVPIEQSYEFYWGLRRHGVETRLVTYPREGHGIAEVPHQRDLYRRVVEWFATHLQPS